MMQDFWNDLLERDKAIFTILNGKWTNPFLDTILPWVRDSKNWIPLYLLIVVFLFYKWGRTTWKWLLIAGINVAWTDQISSSFFKPFFHRLRPCADPEMMHQSRLLLAHCAGGFSFTSSHAANHFGLAMLIVMTLQPLFKNYRFIFLIWAAIIAYAQVYVGVHYLLDVFAGSIIGILVGGFSSYLFHKIAKTK